MTIALCLNASGIEKIKPIIINKNKSPRSFGKTFNPNSICSFYFNKTAWMNHLIFTDWLKKFNNSMLLNGRKVLLIVDNAGGHRINQEVLIQLRNVRLEFLPPNVTNVLQPLDAGIIKSFKTKYRQLLVKDLIRQLNEERELHMPNVKEAMYLIKNSYHLVSRETIINCWKKTNILAKCENLPNLMSIDSDDEEIKKDMASMNLNLIKLHLSKFKFEKITAEDYINCDASQVTSEDLDDEEIIDMVNENYTQEAN